VETLPDLAHLLRELRRRHARRSGGAPLSYRELAVATGWSHGIIGEYFSGRVLPPTDRFDTLVRMLGASPAEQGALATARDRVDERRRAAPPGGTAAQPVPRQLPADVSGFTGRAEHLAVLDALLTGDRAGPPDTAGHAVVISAVSGTAGVGKTTLAVHWAHRVAERFPDGQLYVDLRGYDPERPVSAADALAGLLRSLGVDAATMPGDLAERAACYRTLLSDRRMLVVLDNAYAAEQVRPLLPGTPTCAVVVTSRDDLAGLVIRDGARRIDLDVLTGVEAAALLRTLIGGRAEADPAAAAALAERCAHLPLALRIAAEFAAAHPELPLADLVADLSDDSHRLDLLDTTGDPRTAVRVVFSWSQRHLSAAAARAFARLGLHPGPHFDAYALAALADVGIGPARVLVHELARSHLVAASGVDRYTMHDLLRSYAAERCRATDPEPERAAALSRLAGYYVHAAAVAMDGLFPHEQRTPPVTPRPAAPLPAFGDPDAARAWLDRQRANLVALAGHAAQHARPQPTVDLSNLLWRYFEVGGHYQEALAVHSAAARAAPPADPARPGVLANLGTVHWWLGAHHEAGRYFGESVTGSRAAGDRDGEARALARLALVQERLGAYRQAEESLRGALAIYRDAGNRHGEGAQLLNLGALFRRLGRYRDAIARLRRAAALFADLGDLRLEGYAAGNLGVTRSLLGDQAGALDHLHRALARCRTANDPAGEGSALGALGGVYRRMERFPEALDHLHRSLSISRQTGDRSLETETLNTLGEALRDMGEPEPALERHRAALALTRQTGDRFEQARALEGIAGAQHRRGSTAAAAEHWREALAIYLELGVPDGDRVRARLAP
jgi:tetratricopeptide (TPR) repeat protein